MEGQIVEALDPLDLLHRRRRDREIEPGDEEPVGHRIRRRVPDQDGGVDEVLERLGRREVSSVLPHGGYVVAGLRKLTRRSSGEGDGIGRHELAAAAEVVGVPRVGWQAR